MIESELLLQKIESLRRRLIELVKEKGYTDEETVKVSQQLDAELNKYESIRDINS